MIPEALKKYGPTDTMRRHRMDEANAHDYDMALSRGDTWYRRYKPCPKCGTHLYYVKQKSTCRKCKLRSTRAKNCKKKFLHGNNIDRRFIDNLIEDRELKSQLSEVWD